MRKAEIEAMVEVLEQDWPSPEAAAEAAFDRAVELLGLRDAHGLRVDWAGGPTVFGPIYHKTQAKKLGGQVTAALPDVNVYLGELKAPALLVQEQVPDYSVHCPECSHPKFAHFPNKRECVAVGCKCRQKFKDTTVRH